MPSMAELAPAGRLHCGATHHPPQMSKDSMYFLEEKNGFFVFACKFCTELQRKPQLHVIAANHGARRIYENTRKAAHIDRDGKGNIRSFR